MVGDYGLYAVFLLMLIDAVLPAASEAVMVYGGAVASGAFAGQDVQLFGWTLEPGLEAYLGIALAGTIGYTLGSMGGWWIGVQGRPAVPRAPRPLAAPERGQARARRALVRALGGLGGLPRPPHSRRALVRVDPRRRLRGAVPALHVLTLLGSAIWCFVLAGVGWALGSRWEDFHHAFRYVDYAIIATIVAGAVYLAWKVLRRRGKPATEPR